MPSRSLLMTRGRLGGDRVLQAELCLVWFGRWHYVIVSSIRSDVVTQWVKVRRRCDGARVSELVYVETGSRTLKTAM